MPDPVKHVNFGQGIAAYNSVAPVFNDGEIGGLQLDINGNLKVAIISGGAGGASDTELPAATVLADDTANPTIPGVAAFGMVYDGATWDRLRGNAADGMLVNLGANNDVTVAGTVAVTQSGAWSVAVTGTFWQATQPVSVASLPLPAGAAIAANQQTDALTNTQLRATPVPVSTTDLDIRDLVVGDVVSAEPDGTALANGQVAIDTTAGGTTITAASAGRQGVTITNQGSVACYVGTGTVTTSNGFLLNPGESVALPTDSEVKAITASSSTTIGYLTFA